MVKCKRKLHYCMVDGEHVPQHKYVFIHGLKTGKEILKENHDKR